LTWALSEDSIKLAKSVALARGHDSIAFHTSDFLNSAPPTLDGMSLSAGGSAWDLLLDKGTYDAIALADKLPDGTTLIAGYPSRVSNALKNGGYFLITSCNFTEEELKASFAAPGSELMYHSRVAHPTFSFGGKTGSTVSTVAFRKS